MCESFLFVNCHFKFSFFYCMICITFHLSRSELGSDLSSLNIWSLVTLGTGVGPFAVLFKDE